MYAVPFPVFHLGGGGALGCPPPPKILETNYIILDHKLQSFFVMLISVTMGLKCDLRACKFQKFSGGHAPRPPRYFIVRLTRTSHP